jgi:hypothetical protein
MKSEVNLLIIPDWQEIENVYEAANKFFSEMNFNEEYTETFTMITCELVENSIKYGEFMNNGKNIEINIKIADKRIFISVMNPIGELTKPYLLELDKTIQWVRGFQDPYEAYIERLKEISIEPIDNYKSGLGLVRISYEGRATIDFFINEEKVLNVSAVTLIK